MREMLAVDALCCYAGSFVYPVPSRRVCVDSMPSPPTVAFLSCHRCQQVPRAASAPAPVLQLCCWVDSEGDSTGCWPNSMATGPGSSAAETVHSPVRASSQQQRQQRSAGVAGAGTRGGAVPCPGACPRRRQQRRRAGSRAAADRLRHWPAHGQRRGFVQRRDPRHPGERRTRPLAAPSDEALTQPVRVYYQPMGRNLGWKYLTCPCMPVSNHNVVQDVAWGGVLLSHGGSWARSLPKADLWPLVVLPPIVGELSHPEQGCRRHSSTC